MLLRRPTLRRLLAGLVLLPLLLTAQAATDTQQPSGALDLQYGEILYYYHQNDWFGSIVRTHIAQYQQRLPHHALDAELLLGGLDLSYGLRNEAKNVFERLLNNDNSDEITRNRAWYYLAKISWQRGDNATALQALARISGNMSAGTRVESAHLASLVLLDRGQTAEAIEVLEGTRRQGDWTPYLAYNLGVAYIRNGEFMKGASELDRVGRLEGRNEELRTLRDKANLALGYSQLQQGAHSASRTSLDRVRLAGRFSSKALLGAGWADAEAGVFRKALAPWQELGRRETIDPAVQEALLAVPYAMTKLGLHGGAVREYEGAIKTLFEEKGLLDESITAVRRGELLAALQQQDLRTGIGWLQKLALDDSTPALRYQVTLMARHEFQEAVKNYRDLMSLRNNLQDWADSMDAYDDMLEARETRFNSQRPAARRALQHNNLDSLVARHRQLADRVARIETVNDVVALATTAENRHWQALQRIGRRLEAMPQTQEVSELRERQYLLGGVLYWQMNSNYLPRLWLAKRQLSETGQSLIEAREKLATLAQAGSATPQEFSGFGKRIRHNRATIQTLLERTGKLHAAQGKLIETLAVEELQKQKQRIDTYIVQARFALAQTYDSALVAGKGLEQ